MTPTLEKAARAAHDTMCKQDVMAYLDGKFDAEAIARAVLLAIREPDDDVLRAYYENQFPRADAPAGGFSRWATWDEARETQGPRIQAGLSAAIDAIIGEETA